MEWKNNPDRKPLIVKGARQVGKTHSVEWFAKHNYSSVIEINFVEQKKYRDIFNDGFEVDTILKNVSLLNPDFMFIPGETIFFFDELQACPNCATSLKFFKLDGRFDVICSGSLMGINYKEIEANSVGYKDDYEMYSMDFEEFLSGILVHFNQYVGWFDGNPLHLCNDFTPREEALHILAMAGGEGSLYRKAKTALEQGDAPWAARLADHLLAIDPDKKEFLLLKAEALEIMAEAMLTATGRNFTLSTAQKLREKAQKK